MTQYKTVPVELLMDMVDNFEYTVLGVMQGVRSPDEAAQMKADIKAVLEQALEAAPQAPEWVGLTNEEYAEAEQHIWDVVSMDKTEIKANKKFYKTIEAKLREKNRGVK